MKDLEIAESEWVKKLREENAEKQRQQLITLFKKEMRQLELKIETARNNLNIKMEAERNILEKEINLHVKDIEWIQGLIAWLNKKKGQN